MRVRLFHKLFAAIVIASLASIGFLAVTVRWHLDSSFERYLNYERNFHLAELAAQLVRHYERHGNWMAFHNAPDTWRWIVFESHRKALDRDDENASRGPSSFNLQRLLGTRKFTLYDTDHVIVAGGLRFTESARVLPIEFGNHTVGWLGAPPYAGPVSARDVRFVQRQVQLLSMGAGIACVLSIGVAFFTARRLAAPIEQIGHGARQLADGDFETRLPPLGRDEIGQLADDFNVLARTLQHNESERRRWFADISHELRTPLAIMRGEIDAVHDGIRPNDQRLIESLGHETQRLEQLIEDLYHLARADLGTLDYEFAPCSPGAIITQALNSFAHRFEQTGLSYNYDIDSRLEITGDSRRLSQLVDNILENCYRYVTTPGQIQVTLSRIDDAAEIRIEDSGPGVGADEFDDLFKPFSRIESSRNRCFGGSGLGLAICQRVVTAHGGNITAARSDFGGLALIIRLPLSDVN